MSLFKVTKGNVRIGRKIVLGIAAVAAAGTLGACGVNGSSDVGLLETEESIHSEGDEDAISNLDFEEVVIESNVSVKGWEIQDGDYYGHGGDGTRGSGGYIITINSNYVDPEDMARNTYDITVVNKIDSYQTETLEVENVGFTNVKGYDVLHFGGTVVNDVSGEESEWDIYLLNAGENNLLVYQYRVEDGDSVQMGVSAPNVLIHKDNEVIDRRAEVEEDSFSGTDANGNTVTLEITDYIVDSYGNADYIPKFSYVDANGNTITLEGTSGTGYKGAYAYDIRGICSFRCYNDTSEIYVDGEKNEPYRGFGYFYYDENGDIYLTYIDENNDIVLSNVKCCKN